MSRALYYFDGRISEDPSALGVSLIDRSYLFGDSAFETLRTYRGVPYRVEQHLERLAYSAGVLSIPLPMSLEKMGQLAMEMCQRVAPAEAYLRITLSRGEGPSGLGTAGYDRPMLSMMVRGLRLYPEDCYRNGIRTIVLERRKIPAACIDPGAKIGASYITNILAKKELEDQGLIEGVQLTVDGRVVCGLVSNLFIIQGRRLRTPDLASGCLPGVTRSGILAVASSVGLEASEEPLGVADLFAADEMFFTNTLMEVLPVAQLDHQVFKEAPGPFSRAIYDALKALIDREVEEVASRLTPLVARAAAAGESR